MASCRVAACWSVNGVSGIGGIGGKTGVVVVDEVGGWIGCGAGQGGDGLESRSGCRVRCAVGLR